MGIEEAETVNAINYFNMKKIQLCEICGKNYNYTK